MLCDAQKGVLAASLHQTHFAQAMTNHQHLAGTQSLYKKHYPFLPC